MTPIATVFITVYNEQTRTESAVKSCLGQSLGEIEILVVDDGSTDRTPEILNEIHDDGLRVVHRPRSGQAASLAFAATQARGEYLANLDADDEAFSNRLREQVAFLETHPDHGWVGCARERYGSFDCRRGTTRIRWRGSATPSCRTGSSDPYGRRAVYRKWGGHGMSG